MMTAEGRELRGRRTKPRPSPIPTKVLEYNQPTTGRICRGGFLVCLHRPTRSHVRTQHLWQQGATLGAESKLFQTLNLPAP
ncbi:hypothetical protein CK820_G0056577 [Pan troglodytes]|uniref:Uncharacterized protein n=1 Tax=Pan troglodytes TaxID=9598 RepID=A0A2J8IK11_PANTR|nr:hypothetical protein CK820_G0056577 [Pan troglodytes]